MLLLVCVLACSFFGVVLADPHACANALYALSDDDYYRLFIATGTIDMANPAQIVTRSAFGDYVDCVQLEQQKFCLAGNQPAAIGVCIPQACSPSDFSNVEVEIAIYVTASRMSKDLATCFNSTKLQTPIPATTFPIFLNTTTSTSFVTAPPQLPGVRLNAQADPTKCFRIANALQYVISVTYGMSQTSDEACGSHKQTDLSTGAIVVIVIGLVLCALVGFAYIRGVVLSMKESSEAPTPNALQPLLQDAEPASTPSKVSIFSPTFNSPTPTKLRQPVPLWKEKIIQIVECFDLGANMEWLFSPASPNVLPFLDGLRVFSISWVVFGHLLLLQQSMTLYDNQKDVGFPDGVLASWSGQIIFSAEFAVDSFFYLSGLLVTIGLVGQLQKTNIKDPRWYLLYVFYRFLRLTPSYMFALFFQWKVMPLFSSGPLWSSAAGMSKACTKYWWTNLLYINNLYPFRNSTGDECFAHAWYLANDFQFFLLAPIVIVPFVYKPSLGIFLTTAVTICSLVWVLVLVYTTHATAFAIDSNRAQYEYQTNFYVLPYMRVPPYLIGILTAMLWLTKKSSAPSVKVGWKISSVLHVVSLSVIGMCCYGCYRVYRSTQCATQESNCGSYKVWSEGTRVVYTAWSKAAWAVCLAVLSLLAFNNELWLPLRQLLCNRVMTVLARLSYAVYLIHLTVLTITTAVEVSHLHYQPFSFAQDFVGALGLAFAAAAVLVLVLEKPVGNLQMLLLGKKRPKRV